MTHVGVPTQETFLVTPNFGPGGAGTDQQGLMILDGRGELVWFQPLDPAFSNLRVQTYQGQPVLTWWQGRFDPAGFGQGTGYIANAQYATIATVQGGNELGADLHELVLTPAGTALVTAYTPVGADLSPLGGPVDSQVYAGVVQEIDVATGNVVFEWRSTDHVAVSETYATLGTEPLDYFHINSIAIDPADGNLLISARNTWAIYKLDRSTGAVVWRLNGKASDFTMGPGTTFAWQHDAQAHGGGVFTLFDDGAAPTVEPQSRGLQLALDETARTATLTHAYAHPAQLVSESQGNVQLLADGGVIVGWGSEPYFSHFDAKGNLVRDGRMPTNVESYRAFRQSWSATPATVPDVATEGDVVGGATVYVSWNGATNVATWQVVTGASADALADSGSVPRSGFETAITVHPKGSFLAVRALDRSGALLATSQVVQL
jgi:outer membrane protein assembly factor BamB